MDSRALYVDLTGIASRSFRDLVRSALPALAGEASGGSKTGAKDVEPDLRIREGAFERDSWLEAPEAEGERILLLTDMTTLDRVMTADASTRWLRTARRCRPWVVAFLWTQADRTRAHRVERFLRSFDGRLTLFPDPRGGRARPGKLLERWLQGVVPFLEPSAILEVRPLGSGGDPRLLLRFGDDRMGVVDLTRLELDPKPSTLDLRTAAPGPGGRSLRIDPFGDGDGWSLEARWLRDRLDEDPALGGAGFGGPQPGPTGDPGSPLPGSSLGERVRRARVERGMSQSELGRRAGLHQVAVSNLERDVHSPRFDTIARVARGLDLSVKALLATGVGPPEPADPPR